MSEKKTIQFNPELLKFANGGKTRKARPEGESKSGTMRLKQPRKRDETFKKHSILKMIRKHQQEKYNKMLESFEKPKERRSVESEKFNNDFEESKQFMDKLTDDMNLKKSLHNSTIRHHSQAPTSLIQTLPLDEVLLSNETFEKNNSLTLNQPKYGCLKNGSLPTYKSWITATQKNRPIIENPMPIPIERNNNLLRASELKQRMEKINARQPLKRKQKQKRIVRRTFKIGKSTVVPRVSVLVSNRTIRNKVTTEGQLLKQKPLEEIKRYLIKRGLIRVGTTAPNDVIRKMYECSVMMCGEVQNHNPDNLLYNFFNNDEK
uniref:Uncharacterized protein n=1 Tax=viral metagenome TaxID=1070528 RepID=A0A6C0B9D2_9ZZZZ